MITYKDAGVDVEKGDSASKAAYQKASDTFAGRKGFKGEPVFEEGNYAGLLDMGEYYLIHTTDGTGTKIDLAAEMGDFSTLGYDLLAMVADDAVCTGAEVISVSNCIDVPAIDTHMIEQMMNGLSKACTEQRIVLPAGEIAEVPGAVTRAVWSAAGVGMLEKDKVIDTGRIKDGDSIISLRSSVARCNGFSLIRAALEKLHGAQWYEKEWSGSTSWGEVMLSPSIVYHDAVLELIGRFGQERKVDIKGIAHITGGGIPSKLRRVLKKSGCGALLTDLWQPHAALQQLIHEAGVDLEEAYRTWNMGNGMMLVLSAESTNKALELLENTPIDAKIVGSVTSDSTIRIENDTKLSFS